jgi:hypothetical protein
VVRKKITANDYYSQLLTDYHQPGDIWSGLPTHGLLKRKHATAVIVTPACDLSQRKVDTLTYLPIVSVDDWLMDSEYAPEIVGCLRNALHGLKAPDLANAVPRRPTHDDLNAIHLHLTKQTGFDVEKNQRALREKVEASLRLLRDKSPDARRDLSIVLGKKLHQQTLEKLVRNSFRLDVHFLPPDEQDPAWAAVPQPSVILFRYPLTLPIEVLDAAQDSNMPDWAKASAQLAERHPIARTFSDQRPIRRARLKERFLADAMTRYLTVYIRLGSPDFTEHTIAEYVSMLGGVE